MPGTRAAVEPVGADVPGGPVQYARSWRRARLVIRKIDPWSVLRFAALFYFCLLLIMLLGSAIIFALLKAFGVVTRLEELLSTFFTTVEISGGAIFRWLFLFGLLGTIVATAVTVFLAFLYNLIADVVGGIEIAVSQRD
ncbi:MAG: DUF3566 domain-containing protein [Actinomycetota bacterium]